MACTCRNDITTPGLLLISLLLTVNGCGQSSQPTGTETSDSSSAIPKLPIDGVASEELQLKRSLLTELEPIISKLRSAGAHKPPGIWKTIKAPANPFSIPAEPVRYFKSAEIIDLDHMQIRVNPGAKTAEVTYRRSTFRGPRMSTENEARSSRVNWRQQAWTALFSVTYDKRDDKWVCRQTDYVATVYLPDGRPGQTQKHTRAGVDFLKRELQGIPSSLQAN